MAMLLGKKIGMTQVYDESGRLIPVTVLQAGPCAIMQVKTVETDGYDAVQLGYEEVKASRRRKPEIGHAKKVGKTPRRFVRELRLESAAGEEYKPGGEITVSVFSEQQFVDVTGVSKGRGFAGVMKRHGFKGLSASHGTERKHRAPGSLAAYASEPGHGGNLKKGKKMAGHMGSERTTTRNHRLVSIDEKRNILVVAGAVAGPSGGYVAVRSARTKG